MTERKKERKKNYNQRLLIARSNIMSQFEQLTVWQKAIYFKDLMRAERNGLKLYKTLFISKNSVIYLILL